GAVPRGRPEEGALLGLLEQRQEARVALGLQALHGNEAQRGGVDAVAHARRRGAIVEEMAQVGIAVRGPHLGSLHEERAVGLLGDVRRLERSREAGPPGAGLELVERAEQRLPRYHVHVDAGPVVVPVLVVERRLRRFVLSHLVLQRGQGLPQLDVARLGVVHARSCLRRRGFGAPYFPQAPVTPARHAIHPVPDRILTVIVLVIVFGGVERRRRLDRGSDGPHEAPLERAPRGGRHAVLHGVAIEDRRVVLWAVIAELAIGLGGIDVVPERVHQSLVRDPGGIVHHLYGL